MLQQLVSVVRQRVPLVRQWMFPFEFRIELSRGADGVARLLAEISKALADAEQRLAALAGKSAEDARLTDSTNAIELCNGLFRLRRSTSVMESQGIDCKELRNIHRALENVDSLLNKHGIEYQDLTGQIYDDGRTDFDPIATEEQAGADRKRISLCERPAVWSGKRLIQPARGIVAVPARSGN